MEQLPVELTHFYSTCSEEGLIVLNWTTASELNSKHFVVEQSANGIDFAAITILPAAGNSNNIRHYSTIIPSASGRMYYRLAMVDLDNTLEYSRTILADCHGGFVNGLIIYYTPAEGIVIQSQTSESGKYLVQLFDAAGKLLLQETKYIGPGMNRYVLDVRKKLASGIYFIRAANDAAVFSQKLWIY
jgi:hypothetical protein